MNADEIVRAARGLCARSLTGLNKYHGYIATKSSKHGEGVYNAIIERLYRHEHGIVPELCDLIESMQAQLAEYEALAAEYGIDGQTMLTLAKSQIVTVADNVKLTEQLSASQCRADAARNELCLKCGLYHDAHNGACDGCRWKE